MISWGPRLLAAALLGAAPVGMAADASAVTPPSVDVASLPVAGPPAPPVATAQAEPCVRSPNTGRVVRAEHLAMLDLPSVWKLGRGSGQTVAVIDTGVARHRLLPRLTGGGDYVSSGDGTDDCDGHGTMVAGIIAAATDLRDGDVYGGVAPESTVISIRQSSTRFRAVDDPTGSGFGDVDTLARAIRTAADVGASVVNISSVACVPVAEAPDDRALGAALSYAVDVKNVVVITAAGNVGASGPCREQNPGTGSVADWGNVRTVVSPAWYDDLVLTVGSVDASGVPSRFSLGGPWVDVAAPGEDVIALDPDGEGVIDTLPGAAESAPIAGTSYAAPVVAGIAALVRSRWPHLTARQVMQRIEDTAHAPPTGWDSVVGHGVVDALAALGGASPAPTPRATPRHAEAVPAPSVDREPHKVAFSGAAALTVVAIGAAAGGFGGRLRRRGDVTKD